MGFWKGKKVLVTGASGFIGSHLVEQLITAGANVSGTSRKKNPAFLTKVKKRIKLFTGDLKDPAFCAKTVKKQDIVIHMAAVVGGVHYNSKHPASLFRDNLQPFMNMLEAARIEGVKRFITVSSACVYPRDAKVPTPEEEGWRDLPEKTNEGYGMAKRMQEYLSLKYAEEYGMNIAIPRPYNAYGPRDDFNPETSHVIPALIKKVLDAKKAGETEVIMWGDGTSTRAFLYVDDFARGIMACAEHGIGKGPINIGVDEEKSIKKILESIIKHTKTKLTIKPDLTKPSGQPRRNCDVTRMEKELKFKAKTSLQEGLKKTIKWYDEQKTQK